MSAPREYCDELRERATRMADELRQNPATRVYSQPIAGNGWPSVPPNFLAFRWGNAVRQVNRWSTTR